MFVSVIHRISDPDEFWSIATKATAEIPADLKLPQVVSSEDLSTTICLSLGSPFGRAAEDLPRAFIGKRSQERIPCYHDGAFLRSAYARRHLSSASKGKKEGVRSSVGLLPRSHNVSSSLAKLV